jgi:hypothetical protein
VQQIMNMIVITLTSFTLTDNPNLVIMIILKTSLEISSARLALYVLH